MYICIYIERERLTTFTRKACVFKMFFPYGIRLSTVNEIGSRFCGNRQIE